MTWMGEALSHCCHTDAMPQLRAGFATPTGQEAETAKLWKGHSQRRLAGEGSQRHGCARSSPGGASASGWPLVRRLIRAPSSGPRPAQPSSTLKIHSCGNARAPLLPSVQATGTTPTYTLGVRVSTYPCAGTGPRPRRPPHKRPTAHLFPRRVREPGVWERTPRGESPGPHLLGPHPPVRPSGPHGRSTSHRTPRASLPTTCSTRPLGPGSPAAPAPRLHVHVSSGRAWGCSCLPADRRSQQTQEQRGFSPNQRHTSQPPTHRPRRDRARRGPGRARLHLLSSLLALRMRPCKYRAAGRCR